MERQVSKHAVEIPVTTLKLLRLHLVVLTNIKKCQNLYISFTDLPIKRNSKILFDTINSTKSPVIAQVTVPSKSDSNDNITFFLFYF